MVDTQAFRYVIIGGGLAGGRAVDGIRRIDPEGSIALVAGEHHRPYQRPPLSKKYLRGEVDLGEVYLQDPERYAEQRAELILGVRALRVDPGARQVALDDGRTLSYERLLLATGGEARRLSLPGADLAGVFTLRTIEDSNAIREAAGRAGRALVLGGSFIGSEVAASLTQLGVEVTMAFPESRLLGRIAPDYLSDYLHTEYRRRGVTILPGTVAERLEGEGRVQRAVMSDGSTLEVDMVVMGVGIRLNTELAREAGLEMNEEGAVVVDRNLRTSDPNIYAAGDIAAWPDRTFGRTLRVEHWDVARAQGLRAGRNMAGEDRPYPTLPYFFSDLFDLSFEVWGDLSTWDETVVRGDVEGGSAGIYYFDGGTLTGVLVYGRDAERKANQALVRARPTQDAVADKLRDETVDLASLTQ